MSTPAQLRIAARIHYALKALLGEGIDVAAMLTNPAEAREVLFVCQSSGSAELVALANQYFVASEVARLASHESLSGHDTAPQDADWSQDTSGFGLSQPGDLPATRNARTPAPAARTSWLRSLAQRVTR